MGPSAAIEPVFSPSFERWHIAENQDGRLTCLQGDGHLVSVGQVAGAESSDAGSAARSDNAKIHVLVGSKADNSMERTTHIRDVGGSPPPADTSPRLAEA